MKERLNDGVLKQRGHERAVVGADREVLYLGWHHNGHRDPQGLEPWLISEARELRDWLNSVLPDSTAQNETKP